MGKKKYLDKIGNLFKKSPVVTFDSIKMIVRDKKNVKQYTKQIVRNLIKQNKIKRITKGFYTAHEDPSLAVFCFSGYLGVQNALSFHNLWEQETVPVIITSRKVRQGRREVFGANVIIKRIDKKYMFGFEYYKYPLENQEIYLPYSDIEKTFVDMIYFKQHMDGEVILEFRKKIDKKKLNSYLKKYPKKFKNRVLSVLK
jgi:predicted transcriptional regulator of viral defense system